MFTMFIATLSLTAHSQQEQLDHMNELTETFENLKTDLWGYMKAITQGKKARTVEKKRISLVNQYKEEKSRVSKIKSSELQVAMMDYLDLSITVLDEDFSKILDMEDIAEQSYDAMEAYMMAKEQASEKLNQASDEVLTVQVSFAAANGITLLEEEGDEITKKIEKASNALSYYNEIYLIYFKPFKQEAYALDAINAIDVNALDQNISSLESSAMEGMAKLKELGSYEGNSGLKVATDKMMKFYLKEAEESFPDISQFFMAKERFDKAAEVVNSKNKKKLTQDDVDKYNSASEEYNSAVEAYNSSIEKSNAERERTLEAWNKAVEKFFELHTD